MSYLISSQKRGGAGPSRSFTKRPSRRPRLRAITVIFCATIVAYVAIGLSSDSASRAAGQRTISKAAANRCDAKIAELERAKPKGKSQIKSLQFTEEEVNSYLALVSSSQYHPCLRRFEVFFEEKRLKAAANIDFDRLQATSARFFPKLFSFLFSGSHEMSAQGQLISGGGKGYFVLDEALFDTHSLPKAFVKEIITMVGRKQKPPFDPLSPSALPYGISKVDVHQGYIVVDQ